MTDQKSETISTIERAEETAKKTVVLAKKEVADHFAEIAAAHERILETTRKMSLELEKKALDSTSGSVKKYEQELEKETTAKLSMLDKMPELKRKKAVQLILDHIRQA